MNIEKSILRKSTLKKRNEIDCAWRNKSDENIVDYLTNSSIWNTVQNIHCYCSMGSEVNTKNIIAAAFAAGKTIFVPIAEKNVPELFHAKISKNTTFEFDTYGIPVPVDVQQLRTSDLPDNIAAIVPLIAFDVHLHRIGYGKGYYDRFFAEADTKIIAKIGLAYSIQKIAYIPSEPHDVVLDAVVADCQLYGKFPQVQI